MEMVKPYALEQPHGSIQYNTPQVSEKKNNQTNKKNTIFSDNFHIFSLLPAITNTTWDHKDLCTMKWRSQIISLWNFYLEIHHKLFIARRFTLIPANKGTNDDDNTFKECQCCRNSDYPLKLKDKSLNVWGLVLQGSFLPKVRRPFTSLTPQKGVHRCMHSGSFQYKCINAWADNNRIFSGGSTWMGIRRFVV